MASAEPMHANELIESQLIQRLRTSEDLLKRDLIAYSGEIDMFAPDLFKTIVESIPTKRRSVAILLQTPGGFIEQAERIANILRYHYRNVAFIVTSFCMSAGTVLVMSGDEIYMDYSATLGPIDPQIQRPGSGRFVPALGYLEQFNRMVEKSAQGRLTTAEMAYLLQNFDPGELYQFEQARDLSIALLEEWLAKYKFRNWRETESRGLRATAGMKRERAKRIAEQLNDTADWHSHSRGISMEVLRRKLKLQIEDLADHPQLEAALSDYTALLYDYRAKMGHWNFAISCSEGYHGHGFN